MIHWNVLDDSRRQLIPQLAFLATQDFYLAGGTALALQLGHRTSVDFDFYTAKDLRDVHTMLEWTRKKFSTIDVYILLRAMTYFVDAEADGSFRGKKLLQPIEWNAVKKFFTQAAKKLEKKYL